MANTRTTRSNSRHSSAGSRTHSYGASSFGRSWSTTGGSRGAGYNPSQFTDVCEEIEQRIGSYRNVYAQCTGPGKVTCFSPSTANKWFKFIENGVLVYKFNNPDFVRKFGSQFHYCNPTAAYRLLRQRFGASIKAVSRGKGNCWLVACSENCTARPFATYSWSNR